MLYSDYYERRNIASSSINIPIRLMIIRALWNSVQRGSSNFVEPELHQCTENCKHQRFALNSGIHNI